ncbi:transglycosylase domain-containing protein [Amnibacterium setariae]|uniref:transglycosylase domain-containing protein n=1 Tax=Amnibacterium setariae TaxID=2306585 RepID=UPI0011C456BD|nr:transglycosylase domain-containing protein [Amnibacterium setariae]
MSVTQAALRAGGKLSALLAFFAVAAIAGTLIACLVTPAVAIAGSATGKQIDAFQSLPENLEITPLDQKARIYAKSKGKQVLLASFFNQNRDVVKWDDIPKTVKDATLAAEDVRFYQHGPVDPNGIARALVSNFMHKDIQGASTISQQYVKNVCVQQAEAMPVTDKKSAAAAKAAYEKCTDRSYNRKIREMRLAIGLEKKYDKNEILLGYLNIAGFGGRTYGIEAASQYYYDKRAEDLDIGQAATLISIVNNPEAFRLDKKANLPGAEGRRNYVLATERDHGMITAEEYEKYSTQPIKTTITQPSTGCQTAGTAAFFCTYVYNTILTSPEFGKTTAERQASLMTKGWRIYTTLDLDLQRKAQKAVDRYVPQKPGYADVGAASTSVQVGTGRVLTMVQNKTFKPNGAKNRTKYSAVNYNTDELLGAGAGFQPGSTFKAFTMIGWLKSGHTLGQTVNGNGRTIPMSNFTACGRTYGYGPYQFKNDDPRIDKGNFDIQSGTARSINGVFMSMAQEQDLCDLQKIAQSMGVTNGLIKRNKKDEAVRDKNGIPESKPLDVTPAMAMGTASSVAPLNMAVGYTTIANKGVRCDAIGIDRILDVDGKKVKVPGADCRRVQDEQLMIAAGYDLRNPVQRGTMTPDRLSDGKYLFGKTGTTDDAKDTWVMGSTTKVSTAVWVGNVTGKVNLRRVYSPAACNTGSQFAVMRHCIFQAIQRTMNAKYGGAAGWPTPLPQYLYGGKAIQHADARPQSTPKPPKKDDKPSVGKPAVGKPGGGKPDDGGKKPGGGNR